MTHADVARGPYANLERVKSKTRFEAYLNVAAGSIDNVDEPPGRLGQHEIATNCLNPEIFYSTQVLVVIMFFVFGQ